MSACKSVVFAGLSGAAAALLLWRPAALQPQSRAASDDVSQFRIRVGLNDTAAKLWQGSIAVAGGELAGIKGWRFSQQDRVQPAGEFQFRTKVAALENQLLTAHLYGQTDWGDKSTQRVIPEGLVVRVKGPGRVRFAAGDENFEFAVQDLAIGRSMPALNGNAVVERMAVEERLSESGAADDYPAIAIAPDGARWAAWLSYRDGSDRVMAAGAGRLHEVSGRGDHHSPAIAADGKGRIWVVWSQNDNPAWQLYARSFDGARWSEPVKLTAQGGSNLWPRLASDGQGRVAVVWQGFRNNQAAILTRRVEDGRWSAETQISEGAGNAWAPAATFAGGKLWTAWDSYASGAYQVYARQDGGALQRVTRGENFCVRPSIAAVAGKPLIAWEESDALWGKDFAYLFDRRGTVLYKNRRIRVAYLDGGEWKELAAPVADAVPAALRRFLQQPRLAADESGRLYMTFRCRTSTQTSRIDYWASGGRWETFVTHLDGDRWTPALEMPSSTGRNGMVSAIALHGGSVYAAWPTDNRVWPGNKYGDLDVYATTLAAEGAPARVSGGRTMITAAMREQNPHANESADTRRIRDYRISLGGKTYRILRGDLHRHTELSGDGAGDGSLDDLYRYALDAASMDYAHVGDHQMGNDEEYSWWITQKSNDLYYMPQRFVPLYGYERSVWWPNGHRNVIWAERGKPVLKIGQPEAKGEASSGPILYPYLRATNGIATSHSSATEQGTDWRDNDPALEPMVEIYQGFESNYEHAGAPRAWKEGEATVHQGLRPAGYVWNAWARGYKLGVQASSDHVSTHSSYACILVEDFSRTGLLDAMRKRHTYAATDNIVLDYRIVTEDKGASLMGDIVQTKSRPKLMVRVLGTAPIQQVDVIRNNTYIHKVSPNKKEISFEYVDTSRSPGESYYYIRAEQTDGQLAWSSPIWIRQAER